MAITIALLSFIELELSIHHLCHDRKSKSMTVISFRTMGLALSFFVLVNTQSSILTALSKEHTTADAIFGVIAGEIAIALGIFLLIKNFVRSRKEKKTLSRRLFLLLRIFLIIPEFYGISGQFMKDKPILETLFEVVMKNEPVRRNSVRVRIIVEW